MTRVFEFEPAAIHARVRQQDEVMDPSPVEAVYASHLAHHFETPTQQFEAAKLGMWLFLATEFLLFGGLFCLYAVFRGNHPELFAYGSKFLDTRMGMINTLVLILSSFTMAMAVWAAQKNHKRLLVMLLALTVAGGGVFMGIKYFEYSHKFHKNLVWGIEFYDDPHAPNTTDVVSALAATTAAPAVVVGDARKGQSLWDATCRTCHGVAGEGITGQGKDIRGSAFIAEKTDKQLVDFIKVGRMPFDKLSTTGIQMPPKGGNPMLKDTDLLDIVSYVRTFKAPAAAPTDGTVDIAMKGEAEQAGHALKQEFFIPKSSIPNAMAGPAGLVENWDVKPARLAKHEPLDPRRDPNRPANAHLFFGLYFLMTGLHGLHVLIGMGLIGWLAIRAALGHFTASYFTPVDLTGLYWHVVDIIWIFLFPLLYLIH